VDRAPSLCGQPAGMSGGGTAAVNGALKKDR
jgi:hypothetical protein